MYRTIAARTPSMSGPRPARNSRTTASLTSGLRSEKSGTQVQRQGLQGADDEARLPAHLAAGAPDARVPVQQRVPRDVQLHPREGRAQAVVHADPPAEVAVGGPAQVQLVRRG